MNTRQSLVAVLLAVAAGAAGAQTYTPYIDGREAHEQNRIAQGVYSGSLTPWETARAETGMARIANYEAYAKSDGVVTPYEHHRLMAMENHESRMIYRLKHNGRRI